MKRSRFPDSLVLIFAMIVIAQVLTYVLPAGEYEREGRRVIPGTFEEVDSSPLPPWTFLTAVSKGLEAGAEIIFLVFIVGGVIGILRATGTFDSMIGTAIHKFGKRQLLLVAGMVTLFSLGSTSIGMAEEYMPFIPILVTMCLAMKMDAIVAMGIVYIGAGVGYGCAAWNPFTVIIGQNISGLPPTSGQWYRWILLVITLAIGIHHIMRYVRKIQADPQKSLVNDVDYSEGYALPEDVAFTPRRRIVFVVFVLGLLVFVVGAWKKEWYLIELNAIFLSIGLAAALIARLSPNTVARRFSIGASELTSTALLIGFARTIKVVLDEGQVTDTVIHGMAGTLESFGPHVAAIGMLVVQSICNFFIPSGSGQAYVTMPIMAPLSDLVGVTRQTAVLAYQFGDGFTNMIVPTNALLMGMLVLGRIPYQRWARFIVPLLLKIYVVAVLALILAVQFGYS